jgi:hypothetical protein
MWLQFNLPSGIILLTTSLHPPQNLTDWFLGAVYFVFIGIFIYYLLLDEVLRRKLSGISLISTISQLRLWLSKWHVMRKSALIGLILALVVIHLRRQQLQSLTLPLFSTCALSLMLLFLNRNQLFSRPWARARQLFRFSRHDWILSLISPTHKFNSLINIIVYLPISFAKAKHEGLWLILWFIIGAVVIPLLQIWIWVSDSQPISVITLMTIGIISSFVLTACYIIYWFYRNSPRHIVIPFTAADTNDAELKLIASLVTHTFVKQLRHVARSLNLRQAENVRDLADNQQVLFVTSGYEQEFIEQIQSLTNIELAESIQLPFGSLFSTTLRVLANTRVNGVVHRRQDKRCEVWIELMRRDGHRVAIDKMEISGDTISDLNEAELQNSCKESAVKLMIRLGKGIHLASTWEGLNEFLNGVSASSQRSWWQAVAYYGRAIAIEETIQKDFGTGHYHLGSALIFQGDMVSGLRHLHIADSTSPPLAETQYMLALALLYKHWDKLHEDTVTFEYLIRRCKTASELRSQFPEALHLLGSAYYQRGKLLERDSTKRWNSQLSSDESARPQRNRSYEDNYRQAARYLRQAIKQYREILRRTSQNNYTTDIQQSTYKRLIRTYAMAIHQLADAHRSLRHSELADSLYEDVGLMLPGNLRNLVDRAMTYCVAGNWQVADEFIRNELLSRVNIRWHADANFYMGWALAGGVAEATEAEPRLLIFLEKRFIKPDEETTISDYQIVLSRAFAYLDYAIYQRPRYISGWAQTDWLCAFQKAIERLKETTQDGALEQNVSTVCLAPLGLGTPKYIHHLQLWIAWRMSSYTFDEKMNQLQINILMDEPERIQDELIEPYASYLRIYNRLHELRGEIKNFLQNIIDERNIVGGLQNTWRRLKLAAKLVELWEDASENFKNLPKGLEEITFIERWSVDVYAEVAILASRMLAEGRAYETAREIASKTGEHFKYWLEERWISYPWSSPYPLTDDKEAPYDFKFSPFVVRFQRATLYAWQAYTTLYQWEDFSSKSRLRTRNEYANLEEYLDDAQRWVTEALILHSQHPLAIFVQAQIYRKRNLRARAIEELLHLLNIVAPFDPKSHTANWETGRKALAQKSDVEPEVAPKKSPRLNLYYMERISGQRQFEDFLDRSRIHIALAELFTEEGNLELSIHHFQQAIAWSPYHDLDADCFLELAKRLNRMDRFIEVLDAIKEVKARLLKISQFSLSMVKRFEPTVLEATINSRLSNYHYALRVAESNFNLVFKDADDLYKTILDSKTYPIDNYLDSSSSFKEIFDEVLIRVSQIIEGEDEELWSTIEETLNLQRRNINEQLTKSLNNLGGIDEETSTKNMTVRLLRLADCRLNSGHMAEILPKIQAPPSMNSNFDPEWIIKSQIISFLSQESLQLVIQKSELTNNIAYNRAELNYDLEAAQNSAKEAINLMHDLLILSQDSSEYRDTFKEHLAQYYDTLGWIRYRQGWEYSDEWFKKALEYNQGLAVIHYHLARVLLVQIEKIWQRLPSENRNNVPPEEALQISDCLRSAQRHWYNARQFDVGHRLESKLIWLYQRLDTYKNRWNQIQMLLLNQKNNTENK